MTVGRPQIDRIIDLVTSIYSVDFHPIEPMIATAGGGMIFVNAITRIDSNILIWSTEPIFSKEKEEDENVPQLLSVLRGHSDVTSCCRFSPDGRFGCVFHRSCTSLLASASNDETIRIWRKTEQSIEEEMKEEGEEKKDGGEEENGGEEGGEKEEEEEEEEDKDVLHYECIRILKGHRSGIFGIEIIVDG